MKQGIGFALILTLLLSGCAAPQAADVFRVEDTLPQPTAELRSPLAIQIQAEEETVTPCFSIIFGLPTDAVLTETDNDGFTKLYTAEDGRYSIRTAILPSMDAAQAITEMTGCAAERLHPIRTHAMGMTEYRFSWCREEGDQTTLCSGAVYEDEDCCYTLVFAAPEALAKQTGNLRREVLESFSLYEDEGF